MSFFSSLGHIFSTIATEIHNVEQACVRNQQQVDTDFQIAEGIERQVPGMVGTVPYLVTLAMHGAFGVICAEIKKHNSSGVPIVTNPDGTVTLASGLTLLETVFQQVSDLIPVFEKHPTLASLGALGVVASDATAASSSNKSLSFIPAFTPHQ